jgi:hypothetical protein
MEILYFVTKVTFKKKKILNIEWLLCRVIVEEFSFTQVQILPSPLSSDFQ